MYNQNHREHIGRFNHHSQYPRYCEGVDLDEENILHLSLYELIKFHRGQYYITDNQKMQIDANYDNFPCLPHSVNTQLINLAGTPISRDEAIMHAIPIDKEDDYHASIAVGYRYDRYNNDHLIYDGLIDPHGTWQQVPSLPIEPSFMLGYRPNPNWLPYGDWFRKAAHLLYQMIPDEGITKNILHFFEWRHIVPN